jgi:hypothetical protein
MSMLNDGGLIPNSNTIFQERESQEVSLYEKKNVVQGKIFVRNNYHGKTSNIVDTLSSIFFKYPSIVKDEVESKSLKFFLINNIFVIETENYVVSDAYSYDIDTNIFKNINTKPFYKKKGEVNPYLDVFINPWYDEKFQRVFLVFLTTQNNSLSSSNYKQIVPEIYATDVKRVDYKKIYPLNDMDTRVYSLSTSLGVLPEINLFEYVGGSFKKNPVLNEFNLTYMARNVNALPFVINEKLYYQSENNTFISETPILLKPFYYILDNNYSNPEMPYYVRGISNKAAYIGGKDDYKLKIVENVDENGLNYAFASNLDVLRINKVGKYVIQFDWESYNNVNFFVGCSAINVKEIGSDVLLNYGTEFQYLSVSNKVYEISNFYIGSEEFKVDVVRPTYPDNEILYVNVYATSGTAFSANLCDDSIYSILSIDKTGSGYGYVLLDENNCIYCNDYCEYMYPIGTTLTLIASTGFETQFIGWDF